MLINPFKGVVLLMTAGNTIELGKLFFEEGLPGFLHLQFFQLIQEEPESPFFSMISMEDEHVSFCLIEPFTFFSTYEFTLPNHAKQSLKIDDQTPIAVLVIVSFRSDGQVTANLKAPIIVNRQNRMAKQVILNDEDYQIRQPLFQLRAKAASE
jgi:flagellar assembly factor FliW